MSVLTEWPRGPLERNYDPHRYKGPIKIPETLDDDELLALGEYLARNGVPEVPTNVEMVAFNTYMLSFERIDRGFGSFIEHFDEFLEGLCQHNS